MSAYRKLVSSEAIALLAALCIVAIFVGSYYQRRLDTSDEQALKVAQQVYQLLSKPSAKAANQAQAAAATPAPEAVSLARLKALGLTDPAPITIKVLDSDPTAWKVDVEHPRGIRHYVVTPQGVKEEMR